MQLQFANNMPTTGLTQLILDLNRAPLQRLTKADPQRLAEHYAIPVEWAQEYLNRAKGLK